MRVLYKLLSDAEWANLRKTGRFSGSPVDIEDGFIHFSYADQVAETARKHFAGRENLVLVAVSPRGLEAQLREEVSRGGALFPHLYSELCTENIVWSKIIPLDCSGIPVIGALPLMLSEDACP